MKKEMTTHLIVYLLSFLFITLIHRYFNPTFLWFWIGGLIGTILPDVDHLIYVYYLKPHEFTSQRVAASIKKRDLMLAFDLLSSSRAERKHLVFHTVFFQIIFLVMSFFVISSTASLVGKGLVIGFGIHLIVDQVIDMKLMGDISHWFKDIKVSLNKEKSILFVLAMGMGNLFLGMFV